MLYMVTFTINIPQIVAYIPYMDPINYGSPTPLHPQKNRWSYKIAFDHVASYFGPSFDHL